MIPAPAVASDTSVEVLRPDTIAAQPPVTQDTGIVAGRELPSADVPVQEVPDTTPSTERYQAPQSVRVCAGGDVLLGNNLDTTWALRAGSRLGYPVSSTPDPNALLEPLRPLVADANIVLLNIEGAIGEGPASSKCRPGSRNCYAFRQPAEAARALSQIGDSIAVVGNVANNHAMDAGYLGFSSTQEHLRLAGVFVTGADTLATPVVIQSGDTVAFLGFSTAQAGPDPRDLPSVRRHVARARASYARLVVTMHMGAEGVDAQRTPNESERYLGEDRGNAVAFARAAIDAGASTVIGHGPHVMRAAEWYNDALVLYSLGNLLTYGPFSLVEPLNRGAVVCMTLDPHGAVQSAVLRSTWQRPPGLVAADPTGRSAWLVDSLSQLDFPASAARLSGEAKITRSRSHR